MSRGKSEWEHLTQVLLVSFFFFLTRIYFCERKREREGAREGWVEKGRQRTWSRLQAVHTEPDVRLEPMNREIMT